MKKNRVKDFGLLEEPVLLPVFCRNCGNNGHVFLAFTKDDEGEAVFDFFDPKTARKRKKKQSSSK